MDNREIICIHVGQAGIQIGNAVWELFRFEHELTDDGYQECFCSWPLVDSTKSVYSESDDYRYTPRCMLVDSESMVVEEVRTGIGKNMFDPRSLISGGEGAASTFARGYIHCANGVLDNCLSYLRLCLEQTSLLNGFLIFHSLGGGTGSGLTTRLVEILLEEAPKKPRIHLAIISTNEGAAFAVEPYNLVLSLAALLESASLMCVMQNDALYRNCERVSVRPRYFSFHDINRKVAQITSSLTTAYRFNNKLSSDFYIFQTNLVPFPGVHFPITSYAPSGLENDENLVLLTRSCFNASNMTVTLNPSSGSNMACCMLYRGMGCMPLAINKAIQNLKVDPSIRFVDWCPSSFKISINDQMPGYVPGSGLPQVKRALCVLSNHTAIVKVWLDSLTKYKKLLSRKAFLHWFSTEGIEEDTFKAAGEKILGLIEKYASLNQVEQTNPNKLEEDTKNSKNVKAAPKEKVLTKEKFSNVEERVEPLNTSAEQTLEPPVHSAVMKIKLSQLSRSTSGETESITGTDTMVSSIKLNVNLNSRLKKTTNSDSTSELNSMFLDRNQCYNSLTTLFGCSEINQTSYTKCHSFSSLLRLSLCDLTKSNNVEKEEIYSNRKTAVKFLSKYKRLCSRIKSCTESFCMIREHSTCTNVPIVYVENLTILYAVICNITPDIQEDNIAPRDPLLETSPTLSLLPNIVTDDLRFQDSVVCTTSDETATLRKVNHTIHLKVIQRVLSSSKEFLPSKFSRIFSRRSRSSISEKRTSFLENFSLSQINRNKTKDYRFSGKRQLLTRFSGVRRTASNISDIEPLGNIMDILIDQCFKDVLN